MGGDLVVDFEGQGEGGAAGFGGDARLGAGADGVEEVFEFEAKGFAFGDAGLGEVEAGGGMLRVGLLHTWGLGRPRGCVAVRRVRDCGGGGGCGGCRGREW